MKTNSVDAELRLSEAVGTFGVGAIVDIRGESFVAPDPTFWRRDELIECDRLLDKIGPGELRRPRTIEQESSRRKAISMSLLRFPAWRFCEACGRISRFGKKSYGDGRNKCGACGKGLIPMRFVAACETGSHLQEVPWRRWAHASTGEECSDASQLFFERLRDRGEGLNSLQVSCRACHASRTLDQITAISSRCEGRQPWEHSRTECDSRVAPVLRGATNLFRAEFVSALDIPAPIGSPAPSTSVISRIREHTLYDQLQQYAGQELGDMMAASIASDVGVDVAQVLSSLNSSDSTESSPGDALKFEEWAAFQEKLIRGHDTSGGDFVVDGTSLGISANGALTQRAIEAFAGIGQVRRLREVRAQTGFTRRSPDAKFVPASPREGHSRVFPTAELYGEGIFISFSEDTLASWENTEGPSRRSASLKHRVESMDWASRLGTPSARLLMLHTFSHIILRRLAFESGYSTASLKERLYAGDGGTSGSMCGVLIYTAAPDEQGTLGGLARLGAPERLELLIANALEDAEICSNDPICLETDVHKINSLNLAACHGCCMVSETTCELGNRFLDRQALFGGPKDPSSGFFGVDYLNV